MKTDHLYLITKLVTGETSENYDGWEAVANERAEALDAVKGIIARSYATFDLDTDTAYELMLLTDLFQSFMSEAAYRLNDHTFSAIYQAASANVKTHAQEYIHTLRSAIQEVAQ